jgi:hypothetical protein
MMGISVGARIIGKPGHKGGYKNWESARREILGLIKEDAGRVCTTMFDYYALPTSWPGRTEAVNAVAEAKKVGRAISPREIARIVEEAIVADLAKEVSPDILSSRFICYVQMHEFEAFVFADPACVGVRAGAAVETQVAAVAAEFETPEHINDSALTSPSHRFKRIWPQYDKTVFGPTIAADIGLATLRGKCLHFASWVERLEAQATEATS